MDSGNLAGAAVYAQPCRSATPPPEGRPEEDRKEHVDLLGQAKELPHWIASKWKELHGAADWDGLLDPLDESLRAEIIRYGEFAQVCYDSFEADPQSKYCGSCKYNQRKLFEKVGLSDRGYEVTQYLYATSECPVPDILRLPGSEEKWSTHSNWIGYVAVCTSPAEIQRQGRRDILVCWRGTKTATEWAENLRDILIAPGFHIKTSADQHVSHDGVKVECGFHSVYTSRVEGSMYNNRSSQQQLLPEIKRLLELYEHEELSITITGHSLGGALAVLSSYDIAQAGLNRVRSDSPQAGEVDSASKVVPVTVFTFGCPRVGNQAFRDACESLKVKVLRVVNVNDIVPKVPGVIVNERLHFISRLLQWMAWTYIHVGVQVPVDNEHSPFLKRTSNLSYIHNMETYLHLVDGYHGPKSSRFFSHGRDPALVNKHTGLLKDELLIPSEWLQDENKGLVKNNKGMWVQREREEDDQPHNSKP